MGKWKVHPQSIKNCRGQWRWQVYLVDSLHVTLVINPGVGCHYFLPGRQLPYQFQSVTPLAGTSLYCLIKNRGTHVNNLPWVTAWQQNSHGQNLCPLFGGKGELGPHLAQCGLDQGPPPCQGPSWSVQPFGHNRHGPKIGSYRSLVQCPTYCFAMPHYSDLMKNKICGKKSDKM